MIAVGIVYFMEQMVLETRCCVGGGGVWKCSPCHPGSSVYLSDCLSLTKIFLSATRSSH